jgi:hypothetical protein
VPAGRTALPEVQPLERSVSLYSTDDRLSQAQPFGMGISLHLISCFYLLSILFFVTATITQKWGRPEGLPP